MLKLQAHSVESTKEFHIPGQDSFSALLESKTQNPEANKYSEDFEDYVKNVLWPSYVPPTLTTHPEMILGAMEHAVDRYYTYIKNRDNYQESLETLGANICAGYNRILSDLQKPFYEYQLIEKRHEGFTVAVVSCVYKNGFPTRAWDVYKEYSITYDRKGANCTNFRLFLEKSSVQAGEGCIYHPLPDLSFNGNGSYLDAEFANYLISFFDYGELGDSIFYLREAEEVVASTKFLEAHWASKAIPDSSESSNQTDFLIIEP